MCGRIKIKQGHTCVPVEVKRISHFEGGKGNFIYVYLICGKQYKVWNLTLAQCLSDKEIAASDLFIQASKSYIINWDEVELYEKNRSAVMKNKCTVLLNEEGSAELEKRLFSDKDAA